MNETQETNVEQSGAAATDTSTLSVPVTQPTLVTESPVVPETENTEPVADSVTVPEEKISPVPVQEPVVAMTSSGGVSVGDVWANEETSFRVDMVTAAGGVSIRFRTQDTLDGSKSSFIRKARALFAKKKTLPHGEWFFGSGEEIRQFVTENGYQLEKRKEEKENKEEIKEKE